ncbi:MAG: DNA polymerase III subunit gamma/tau [Oscillospiraceae bacterium]|nr:DNA polymerase III subunit gamma/tau [Oscillospiraceae bacterium]
MYQALYRKFRPRTFADVVGQGHITDTLRRQVAENRTSHAYLFTGTRGTGKTTCAKILAKAVNCEHPVNGDPCNCCPSCLGIESGTFLDVLELDAASNNGVDQVRALRDEAIYSPAHVRKRVYIVDEVHMLSTAAFNALLKILEEPPEHLVFILATTELHKVPATILSRCQRFSFKRITPEDIVGRLLEVAKQENIALSDGGADLLSRLSDGALRDALSLLDQCAAGGGAVDEETILATLGLAGRVQTAELMGHILRRDSGAALVLLDKLYSAGKDVSAVMGELTTLVRDLLIRMTTPKGAGILLSGGYDTRTMDELSAGVSPRRLLAMANVLQDYANLVSRSGSKRLDAELCLLQLSDESLMGDSAALAARIDRLEEQVKKGISVSAVGAAAPMSRPVPAAKAAPVTEAAPMKEPAPMQESAPAFSVTPPKTAKPKQDDLPPWELDAPPLPEEPPFPMDEPPLPVDAPPLPMEEPPLPEEPPLQSEPVFPISEPAAPVFAVRPAKPAASAVASGGDSTVWQELLEHYKNRISPMYRAFLNVAQGRLEGDLLTVVCQTDLAMEKLKSDAVATVLREVTSTHTGREIRLAFAVGKMETKKGDVNDLIALGNQFGGFTIK